MHIAHLQSTYESSRQNDNGNADFKDDGSNANCRNAIYQHNYAYETSGGCEHGELRDIGNRLAVDIDDFNGNVRTESRCELDKLAEQQPRDTE